jgi:hypothetical protein
VTVAKQSEVLLKHGAADDAGSEEVVLLQK